MSNTIFLNTNLYDVKFHLLIQDFIFTIQICDDTHGRQVLACKVMRRLNYNSQDTAELNVI
jgi:hypothetical protein